MRSSGDRHRPHQVRNLSGVSLTWYVFTCCHSIHRKCRRLIINIKIYNWNSANLKLDHTERIHNIGEQSHSGKESRDCIQYQSMQTSKRQNVQHLIFADSFTNAQRINVYSSTWSKHCCLQNKNRLHGNIYSEFWSNGSARKRDLVNELGKVNIK